MKVGYILEQFPGFQGTAILNEMLELEAQGVELHVFSLALPGSEPRHEELAELQAETTQVGPLAPKTIFEHLEGRWRTENPDAQEEAAFYTERINDAEPWRNAALALTVPIGPRAEELGITHFHAHGCGLAAAVAAETSRLTGIPYSFALEARDLSRPELSDELLNTRLKEASFAVAECKLHAAKVVVRCGVRAGSWIRVIYKGCDLMRWTSKPQGPKLADFVAVGPLEERKGFDDLLRACALLKERGHRFRAVVIGTGTQESRLKALRKELGLGDVVDFAGAMTHDEVRKAIARSTALVAPSVRTESGDEDGIPMAVIEAMALGVPPITTPKGAIAELVDDPSSGWLVPARDPEALMRAMRKAMKLPEESARRAEGARARAEALLDLEANVACLAKMMYRSSRRKVANQTRNEEFARYSR